MSNETAAPTTATAHGRIVVGADSSDGGRHALAWAAHEAARRGAVLEAVHAWITPVALAPLGGVAVPGDDAAFEAAASAHLDELLAEVEPITSAAGVTVEKVLVPGHATTALLERHEHADLLVVGTRGHGAFAGMLLGSIAHQCVQHATRPVAVVPIEAPLPADGPIVVGVDGSEESWAAVRWGVAEAGLRGGSLVLVHGWWKPSTVAPLGAPVGPAAHEDLEADARTFLGDMLDGILTQAAAKPAEVDVVAVDETPAKALIDRSHGAGAVVVGSRGRGGFTGLLLGSVSQRVIHHAASAVVVVR